MSDPSLPNVGRAVVEDYLDAVERALVAAHAPRGERMQVVQDLESQISEMLASEPAPLTEQAVRAVIARLEPPEHFAATYGNGGKKVDEGTPRFASWSAPKVSWAYAAMLSSALILLAAFLFVMAADAGADNLAWFMLLTVIASIAFTPYALVRASREQDITAKADQQRWIVLTAAMSYCLVVPVIVVAVAVVVTHGALLMAFGVVGFVYLEFMLARWAYRKFGGPAMQRESCPPLANGVCATGV